MIVLVLPLAGGVFSTLATCRLMRRIEMLVAASGSRTWQLRRTRDFVASEPTVRTHVANILSKLHLADRTRVAIYALRERLVPLDEPWEGKQR